MVSAFAMKDTPPRSSSTPISQHASPFLASGNAASRARGASDASGEALLGGGGSRHGVSWNREHSPSMDSFTGAPGTGGTDDPPPNLAGEGDEGAVVAHPSEVRRAKLLVFALAVQHVPEALACGVAFAAVATHRDTDGDGATLGAALSLTMAIGLQDIPEGAMAAFVLRNLGWSRWDSFMYGQATGLVQPLAGVLGAAAVLAVQSILPYALAFASAAMLFVVIKDMVPDVLSASRSRNTLTLIMMGAFVFMAVASSLIDQVKLDQRV